MLKFYAGLSPTQQFVIKMIGLTLYVCAASLVLGQVGRSRAYQRGLRDGMGPAKEAELKAAERKGYTNGWYDGAWANDTESFKKGIEFSLNMADIVRTTTQTNQAINAARNSAANVPA